ncbi:MAG: polynucleotide adenylyltransferase PcnB [Sulfurimicrobium sp.]
MIRKFIRKVFSKATPKTGLRDRPRIIPESRHGIRRNQLSPCALKVTGELQHAGYAAFVVGGAVRDLLLGKPPKDYDVATDATPEEVRHLFRRSRIIGRRFRLVHVMCGAETIEVSTFRGSGAPAPDEEEDQGNSGLHVTNANGRILRDNVFGSQAEDALRRDFTINAMFYHPGNGEIWDYHNGYKDIKAGVLRIIGDPRTRYQEDPVRMLRAARFAAKLEFQLDPATRAPIAGLGELLQDVPPSRLFDEILKLLLSGHAQRSLKQLRAEGLHHGVLPLLDVILEQPMGERFVSLALHQTDLRVKEDKPVSPAFLFAALLWHEVLALSKKFEDGGERPAPALHQAMDQVIQTQVEMLAIPRRFTATMKEIWGLQPRFAQRAGKRPFVLLSHPRFRAGFDFLLLRCESGELDMELGRWWEKFQHASEAQRAEMLQPDTAPKKRRRRRKPKSASSAALETDFAAED